MKVANCLLVVVLGIASAFPAAAGVEATCPFTVTDSLSASDPTIPGTRLFRDDPPSTCAASTNCTPVSAGPFFYKSYSFTNLQPGTACVTATITSNCNGNSIQAVVYTPTFDPNNTCGAGSNYLADSGFDLTDGVPKSFSFQVLAGATFVVVVNGTVASGACQAYTLTVVNCAVPVELLRFEAD